MSLRDNTASSADAATQTYASNQCSLCCRDMLNEGDVEDPTVTSLLSAQHKIKEIMSGPPAECPSSEMTDMLRFWQAKLREQLLMLNYFFLFNSPEDCQRYAPLVWESFHQRLSGPLTESAERIEMLTRARGCPLLNPSATRLVREDPLPDPAPPMLPCPVFQGRKEQIMVRRPPLCEMRQNTIAGPLPDLQGEYYRKN